MATHRRPHVTLFFLGGSMIGPRHGFRGDVRRPQDIAPWLTAMGEMEMIAEVSGVWISSGQETVSFPVWASVAKDIQSKSKSTDGFIVVHQGETLLAGATVLSCMLEGLDKPVVLTTSNFHEGGEQNELAAKANFINALQTAVSDLAEVVVVAGCQVIRATTVEKFRLPSGESRISGEIIGKIDFGMRFFGPHLHRQRHRLRVLAAYDDQVAVIDYLPGMPAEHLGQMIGKAHGVFLSFSEPLRTIEPTIRRVLQHIPSTIPVCLFLDRADSRTWPRNIIPLYGPSRTAAVMRFIWALGQRGTPSQLRQRLLAPHHR